MIRFFLLLSQKEAKFFYTLVTFEVKNLRQKRPLKLSENLKYI